MLFVWSFHSQHNYDACYKPYEYHTMFVQLEDVRNHLAITFQDTHHIFLLQDAQESWKLGNHWGKTCRITHRTTHPQLLHIFLASRTAWYCWGSARSELGGVISMKSLQCPDVSGTRREWRSSTLGCV